METFVTFDIVHAVRQWLCREDFAEGVVLQQMVTTSHHVKIFAQRGLLADIAGMASVSGHLWANSKPFQDRHGRHYIIIGWI